MRVSKLAISALYFALSLAHKLWQRWQGHPPAGTCVVLYYHSVPNAYCERFKEQMNMVSKQTAVIDVCSMSRVPENTHAVVITFDDALESFAENAVPVLEELGIPAAVFAIVNAMGGRPTWGESYFSPEERVMSLETLRSLPKNITVGSHTLTHRDLSALRSDDVAREIGDSRQRLEEMLGHPVTLFSFPFGAFDDSTVRQCREAGYEHVFTTEPEMVSAGNDSFVVGRVAADPWDWPLEFRLKLAGAYCWQPWARTLRNRIRARLSAVVHSAHSPTFVAPKRSS